MNKLSEIRIGNFTSSEIYSLTGITTREMTDEELYEHKILYPKSRKKLMEDLSILPDAAFTYIKTKIKERNSKRCLSKEFNSKPTNWGKFLETWIVDKKILPDYNFSPTQTNAHQVIENWVGSKDGNKKENKAVIDLKCPFTLESFCEFAELYKIYEKDKSKIKDLLINGYKYENGLDIKHKDGTKFYWQLCSNCAIDGVDKAELIVFIPNEEQLEEIIDYAGLIDLPNLQDFYFIAQSIKDELPYLPKNSTYKNMYVFEIDIPKEDISFLESRVLKANSVVKNH